MADRVPQMLPPDVSHFIDREAELGALDALVSTVTPMVVSTAIAGTAGMGKISLAVRWAHRVRDRFPDGQLYVNLRGYDPGPAVTPEQAWTISSAPSTSRAMPSPTTSTRWPPTTDRW